MGRTSFLISSSSSSLVCFNTSSLSFRPSSLEFSSIWYSLDNLFIFWYCLGLFLWLSQKFAFPYSYSEAYVHQHPRLWQFQRVGQPMAAFCYSPICLQ